MAVTNLWVGGATTSGATVVARLDSGTNATLKVSTSPSLTSPVDGDTVAISSGLAKMSIAGLSAGTQYYYGISTDGTLDTVTTGSFRTAPSGAANFEFAFGSCNTTGDSSDAFTRALSRDPDLCLITGDLHYEDPGSSGAFHTGFDSQLATAMGDMLAAVPTGYTWSDHDWSSDNNGGASSGMNATANSIYRDRVPHWTLESGGSTGIYQTFVWGRCRFIITDERSFKSPNSATDDSSKTMLGSAQKTWFKGLMDTATEPVIFWVGDTPWNGSAAGNDDEWFAYDTERQELASYISASGQNVIRVCGDMHAVAADDGTNSPGGIPILHAAPWYNTFSNKGGPYTDGPYPTSGSSSLEQYGYVTVADTGSQITVSFAGYDTSDVEQVSLQLVYATSPAPPEMPTGDLAPDSYSASGWSQICAEDFDTDCTEGSFLSTYPTWFAYPDTWTNSPATSTYNGGNSVRVEGGIAKIRYFHDGSVARTEALEPPNTGEMVYGVYEVCYRLPAALPGYKQAFLLWPESDVWGDGEVDYPECNFEAGSTIGGFVHEVGANPENNAYSFDSLVDVVADDWHTARTVWADDHLDFYLDGVLIGTYTSTTHVPDNPHRWVLQTEAGSSVPSSSVEGDLEIAYVAAWELARATSEWSAPVSATTPSAVSEGTASATIAFTGTVTGERVPVGAVAGTLVLSGTAAGQTAPQGAVTASLTLVGTATGESPLVIQDGSAEGTLTFVGEATGTTSYQGTASGTITLAGTPAGLRDSLGSVTATITLVGTAVGEMAAQGEQGFATGSIAFVGTATGIYFPMGAVTTALHFEGVAVGTGSEPLLIFEPPTHEEPIRTTVAPLKYFRLTYANSIVRVNGAFVSIRTPHPELLEGLTEGEDYFRGGYIYRVSQAVANELAAAGYTIQ